MVTFQHKSVRTRVRLPWLRTESVSPVRKPDWVSGCHRTLRASWMPEVPCWRKRRDCSGKVAHVYGTRAAYRPRSLRANMGYIRRIVAMERALGFWANRIWNGTARW